MQNYLIVRPVGVVKSNLKKLSLTVKRRGLKLDEKILAGAKRDEADVSEIIINPEYETCLDGIEAFSHIIVLYWAHHRKANKQCITKVHPAGKKEYPLVGVFATRSPARPNPVCATTVELLERRANVLRVRGLDAVDSTPIIDIKVHTPCYDSPSNVRQAEWMDKLVKYFEERVK